MEESKSQKYPVSTPKLNGLEPTKPAELPTLLELFDENIETIGRYEGLNKILNSPPPEKWIKEHPYIPGYRYLPIDKVEFLLRKIFKKYRIRITGQGTAFNGVWVTVRVWYLDPVDHKMTYEDGIGSIQLQTARGTSPADLANINNGAVSMAFPIAKTLAIKDACDLIGNIFGANINRRDSLTHEPDSKIADKYAKALEDGKDDK